MQPDPGKIRAGEGEYILYVGRISPEKGTLDLVEGYRKAKTGKKLVLVGPLDDSEYCRAVQQQVQNDPNIIMTDYVVGDPLKELYSNCGLFVLPSHTEGFLYLCWRHCPSVHGVW